MNPKDLLLISHLRNNAREPMTLISKKTKIPVSTIFDKLKAYEGTVIKKHTTLLNFHSLGYDVKAHLLYKVVREDRERFQRFLKGHEKVNSIYRVNGDYDYLVEAVFTDLKDYDDFVEKTEQHRILAKAEHFILEDIAREQFMTWQPGPTILRPMTEILR